MWRKLQGTADGNQRRECQVPFASLNTSDVRAVQPAEVAEFVLRQSNVLSPMSDGFANEQLLMSGDARLLLLSHSDDDVYASGLKRRQTLSSIAPW